MAKDYSNEFYKDYKTRSKASLKAEIRESTKELNARLQGYDVSKGSNFVKSSLYRINLLAGSKQITYKKAVLGLTARRDKESLIRQARELKAFNKWDIYTPEGKRALEERERKAYETFTEHEWSDISKQQWKDMVEAFGAIGADIITEVSSDDFVRAYSEASDKGKVRFVDIYKEMEKEYAEQGLSPADNSVRYDFILDFKERLKNYSE